MSAPRLRPRRSGAGEFLDAYFRESRFRGRLHASLSRSEPPGVGSDAVHLVGDIPGLGKVAVAAAHGQRIVRRQPGGQ
jgi:hypothetical protein